MVSEELTQQINARIETRGWTPVLWKLVIAGMVILAPVALFDTGFWTIPLAAFVLALLASAPLVHRRDEASRRTNLNYVLDATSKERFGSLDDAFRTLGRAQALWYSRADGLTRQPDGSLAAGFAHVERRCQLDKAKPPYITTNVIPWSLSVDGLGAVYFLPDRLLTFHTHRGRRGQYADLAYEDVERISCWTSEEPPRGAAFPADAVFVGYRWRHTRPDGGPDLDRGDNASVPIFSRGWLCVGAASDIRIYLATSDPFLVDGAVTALRFGLGLSAGRRHPFLEAATASGGTALAAGNGRRRPRQHLPISAAGADDSREWAYTALGVSPESSAEAITQAYRQKAQQYHPDKVAGMAPEFLELAERRMRQINAAYQALRSPTRLSKRGAP